MPRLLFLFRRQTIEESRQARAAVLDLCLIR